MKKVISFLLCSTLYACQNSTGGTILRMYYNNGNIESEVPIDKDSLRNGLAVQYYENGKEKMEIVFRNDKKEGRESAYYENGNIEYTGINHDDVQDSIWTWYYEDGKIKETVSYIKGHFMGENISYFQNGQLERYRFFSFNDKVTYFRRYSELGQIIEEEGVPVFISQRGNHHKLFEKHSVNIVIGLIYDNDLEVLVTDITKKVPHNVAKVANANEMKTTPYGKSLVLEQSCQLAENKWAIDIRITDKKQNRDYKYSDTLSFFL